MRAFFWFDYVALCENRWHPHYLEIRDGEENKSVEAYVDLANRVLELEVTRKTPLIGEWERFDG